MANRRLFVALEPPEPVRRRLATLQRDLGARAEAAPRAQGPERARSRGGEPAGAGRPPAAEVRWVPPENVHLTLQFLGAVPEERVADVEAALRAAAAAARPLALEVKGAGGFPNARRPRVLWAGVTGDVAGLAALAADLGRRLAPLGFPPEERAFTAHLTLGRARDPRGAPGLAGALASASDAAALPWRAAEVVLFESHLSPHGPRYEAVARAPLGAP